MNSLLPYRPHPSQYWLTLGYRFSSRTIRRHRAKLMRGIVNRELRTLDAECVSASNTEAA